MSFCSVTIEERLERDIETAEQLVRIATTRLEWARRETGRASAACDHLEKRIAGIEAPAAFLRRELQAGRDRREAATASQLRAERDLSLSEDRLQELISAKKQLLAQDPES